MFESCRGSYRRPNGVSTTSMTGTSTPLGSHDMDRTPTTIERRRFGWTAFFSELADKLLQYRDDRGPLIAELHEISARISPSLALADQFDDGTKKGRLQDICPFTTIGFINRSMTDANRRSIANELATFLEVQEPIPALDWAKDGIPFADNRNVWFFAYARDRKPGDIDALWRLFVDAREVADMDDERCREAFVRSYDNALTVKKVGVSKLTMGLFWIRPWSFPSLDKKSHKYIEDRLGGSLPENAREYLELRDRLLERFLEPDAPVHSFPELTWSGYNQNDPKPSDNRESTHDKKQATSRRANWVTITLSDDEKACLEAACDMAGIKKTAFVKQATMEMLDGDGLVPEPPPSAEYTIDAILADGCFLSRAALEKVLSRLQTRKNLILQGPPGTGKTWLAKKLAFALLGRKDEGRIRHLQFHPNLSYEDFVRGHRPVDGRLELTDGPFLKLTEEARDDPDHDYVIVIEEINRGNPAQIFGEMLTLLEADKRTPDEALVLAFPRDKDERVHVPPNVYLIGTMNVADRSLALVDLALRRRFAFVDLEPVFGESWRRWMRDQGGFDDGLLGKVADRMDALNQAISADASLGKQFRVGHSYLTVAPGTRIANREAWYREVVETEIGPLLREYWFDQPDKTDAQEKRLLADL